VKFCLQCGQEYYHVRRGDGCFLPHEIGFAAAENEDEAGPGYLMPAPRENGWSEDRLPDERRVPRQPGSSRPAAG
jgi:hypothetical protein